MLRKITYGIFRLLGKPDGFIFVAFWILFIGIVSGFIIFHVKDEKTATVLILAFCYSQGIIMFRVGRHGQKISDEIKDFKENRKILCSTKSTSNQKETAAIKMLAFKDIKPSDLSAIMDNTTANSEINNLVLDKISLLREKGELEDDWR